MFKEKYLVGSIKFFAFLTFFVPIVVIPSNFIFPFIVPKIVLFRSLVILMLGAYICLLMIDWERFRPRLTPVTIVVLLFLLSFVVSTFVGVDWYRSFWDNHERMLGLFTIAHYALYYIILTSVIRGLEEWRWMMRVFLGAGVVVMIIAIIQTYFDHELFLNRGAVSRVSSTLGNSIYLSGYGLFLLFLGYFLAVKEQSKKTNLWFWYSCVGAGLGFWGIFLGGTRGALLGLVAGLGVLFLSYIFGLKEHVRTKRYLIAILIFGICLLGIFYAFRHTEFVKNIPAVGRLVNTEISSKNPRVMAWGVAIDAWKEKPIFGWGPNNYYYAFNSHYRPEFLEYGWGETWFDNAHSVIMNTLAVQGIVGIFLYLGLYIIAIILLWRVYRRGYIDVHIASALTAFLIAHLVSLVTVFENPTSYMYFFFMLAFLNTQIQKNILDNKSKKKILSTSLIISVVAVIFLFIYSTNINPARANMATLKAIRGFSNGDDVILLYNKAKEIPTPHIDDIRNDISRTSEQAIINLFKNNRVADSAKLFELTYEESKKNMILHPYDIRVHIQLSQLSMLGAEITRDARLLFEAEKYLEEALVLSPKRQQIEYILSALKAQLGKGEEGVKILRNSVENNPSIADGWWRLAVTLYGIGEKEEAAQIINDALGQGIKFSGQGQQVVDLVLSGK